MDKKNLLIVILGGLAVVFLFLFIIMMDSAKRGQEAFRKSEDEKSALGQELDSLRGQRKSYEEKIQRLNGQMDSLNGEKQKLQEQADNANRDRDNLNGEINRLNGELQRARSALDQAKNQQQNQQQNQQSEYVRSSVAQSGEGSGSNEYWASVLRQKAALEMKIEELERQFTDAKLAGEKLKQEKSAIEQDVSTYTRENQDVKRELAYNKKLIDSLTLDLALEKNNNFEIKKSLSSLLKENKELKTRLSQLGERKDILESKIADLKTKNVELEESVEKMQVFVASRLQQVDALKGEFADLAKPDPQAAVRKQQERQQEARSSAVDLPPIVISPSGGQAKEISSQVETLQKAAAEIIAINKDSNFVIVNKGTTAGMKVGDSLKVYDSGNRPAGEVEVIQVRDNISAADIKKEIQPLRVGFSVK